MLVAFNLAGTAAAGASSTAGSERATLTHESPRLVAASALCNSCCERVAESLSSLLSSSCSVADGCVALAAAVGAGGSLNRTRNDAPSQRTLSVSSEEGPHGKTSSTRSSGFEVRAAAASPVASCLAHGRRAGRRALRRALRYTTADVPTAVQWQRSPLNFSMPFDVKAVNGKMWIRAEWEAEDEDWHDALAQLDSDAEQEQGQRRRRRGGSLPSYKKVSLVSWSKLPRTSALGKSGAVSLVRGGEGHVVLLDERQESGVPVVRLVGRELPWQKNAQPTRSFEPATTYVIIANTGLTLGRLKRPKACTAGCGSGK